MDKLSEICSGNLYFFCALYVAFVWLLCFKTAMKPVMYSFFIHNGESDEKVKHLKIAWCHFKFVWSYKLIMTQRILAKKHFPFKQPPSWRNWITGFIWIRAVYISKWHNTDTRFQSFMSTECLIYYDTWSGYNIGNLMARLLQIDFAYNFMWYVYEWRIAYHKA